MKKHSLKIGEWKVDFLFSTHSYDIDEVLMYLYDMDADSDVWQQAIDLMESSRMNCGFTFTNAEIKRALVVIGPTSSGKQFVNTLSHEVHHVAVAIASSIGYNLEGEKPAYLAGDTMMSLIETVCELGCQHCRE